MSRPAGHVTSLRLGSPLVSILLVGVAALVTAATVVAPVAAEVRPGSAPAAEVIQVNERVVSSPVTGGGYPGAAPAPGGCVQASYDSNVAEAALALRPGSEQLVGGAKAYFDRWSTFKAQHTVSFAFGRKSGKGRESGRRASTNLVGGFDCVSTGTQAMPPSWTNVTDPNLAWDTRGRIYQLALPFNAYWGSVPGPNGDVVAVHSDDGGRSWVKGNGGTAVETGPEFSVDSDFFLDKPWIAANQNPHSPWRDHVYGAWVLFTDGAPQIHTAVTRDRGATWIDRTMVATPTPLGAKNPWPMIAVGPDGVVYLSYVTYGEARADGSRAATIWSATSIDDGRTWGAFTKVVDTSVIAGSSVPGTTLHLSIVQYLAVSPDQPGHLFLGWNEMRDGQVDVRLTSSTNAGATWSTPVTVNDDIGVANQFSATVAAGPGGALVVGFYDFRLACPTSGRAILPANRGKSGTCIGLTLQAYRDTGTSLSPVGGNVPASRHLWDPYQPGGTRGGVTQRACESPADPCTEIFLGDYFGLQVSATRVYVLSSSTYYPSKVRGDDGRRLRYQQQVLTTVSRRQLGL